MDRVSVSGTEDWRFESSQAHKIYLLKFDGWDAGAAKLARLESDASREGNGGSNPPPTAVRIMKNKKFAFLKICVILKLEKFRILF